MNSSSDSSRLSKFKHPGSKRLMLEAQEMMNNSESHQYSAQPMEDNLFEWHFTFRGSQDTEFEGGIYHGRLSFPNDYPMKPPSVYLLTPNGRFETNTKICLSISGHHPETWQPSWSIRTALVALMSFMPTETNRAIGSLDYSVKERRELARKSRSWCCDICGPIENLVNNQQCNNQQPSAKVEQTSNVSDNIEEDQHRPSSGVDELNQSNRNFMLKSTFVLLLILLFRRIFMIA